MSISQLERKLERLGAQIETCQTELTGLKDRRNELKAQLEDAKRAAKNGLPVPQPIGLLGTLMAHLNAAVFLPLARLIGIRGDGF